MRAAALALTCCLSLEAVDWTVQARGKAVTISAAETEATVFVFVSILCPVSNAYIDRFTALYGRYTGREVRFVFVAANANESEADIEEYARVNRLPYTVYSDRRQILARQLNASLTPEAFVFDRAGNLRYQGRIDDSLNPARIRTHDLEQVILAVLSGIAMPPRQTKAFGCTLKRART